MTIRINKMVRSMAFYYPAGFEITDSQCKEITDDYTANDNDTKSKYDHSNDSYNISDPPPDTPKDSIIHDYSIADLYNENASIIINPVIVDHHVPIAGVETNHDNQNEPEPEPEPSEV